tara:strand:- start:438 stop:677 length:240 start_codon:yes stop_codon:yes gene_type:complete
MWSMPLAGKGSVWANTDQVRSPDGNSMPLVMLAVLCLLLMYMVPSGPMAKPQMTPVTRVLGYPHGVVEASDAANLDARV